MKKKIITVLVVVGLMLMNAVPSFALRGHNLMFLGTGQGWAATKDSYNYSGRFTYVVARCWAIYADSGPDYLTKIQVRVKNMDHKEILRDGYVVLEEGTGRMHALYVKEGFILPGRVFFEFKGMTDTSAYGIVDYYAR